MTLYYYYYYYYCFWPFPVVTTRKRNAYEQITTISLAIRFRFFSIRISIHSQRSCLNRRLKTIWYKIRRRVRLDVFERSSNSTNCYVSVLNIALQGFYLSRFGPADCIINDESRIVFESLIYLLIEHFTWNSQTFSESNNHMYATVRAYPIVGFRSFYTICACCWDFRVNNFRVLFVYIFRPITYSTRVVHDLYVYDFDNRRHSTAKQINQYLRTPMRTTRIYGRTRFSFSRK